MLPVATVSPLPSHILPSSPRLRGPSGWQTTRESRRCWLSLKHEPSAWSGHGQRAPGLGVHPGKVDAGPAGPDVDGLCVPPSTVNAFSRGRQHRALLAQRGQVRNLAFHRHGRIFGSVYTRLASSLAHLGCVQLLTCLEGSLLYKLEGS